MQAGIAATRRALQLDPHSAEAHANLATALHLQGDDETAIASYEAALGLDPDRPESHYGLGAVLAKRSAEEAAACFSRAVSLDPDYAEAHCALGAALHMQGRSEEALAAFARALALDAEYVEAHRGRAAALQVLARPTEAAEHYAKAAALVPEHAATWLGLAAVERALGHHQTALRAYQAALGADPACSPAQLGFASLLHELGRLEDSRHTYEELLAREPHNTQALCALLALAPVARGDPHLRAAEQLLRGAHALAEDERIRLDFALGKALAEAGDPERAFEHLRRANLARRRQLTYDEAATLALLARIREVFTPELLAAHRGVGDPSPVPIFIVGMPRSGSTLLEQVLASVPGVFGAGERPDFRAAVERAGLETASAPYPERVPEITNAQLRQIAADYLGSLRAAAPEARRITDKMLMNFCFVGLIHLALPQARILHIRRDPIDTCLSCFATHFEQVPFAFDLGELGRYYRAYCAVMSHWQAVLPRGVMLEVSYERLVESFEPEVRGVLAHCGLEWHEACRAFHKTPRTVATASKSQVRQPLYRSSIGRWRPDAEKLRPLIEGLGR